ncbi:hypothetical protein LA080_014416 [Diaporthe eres]|uniref:CFEM domain-containing protein n=1 Tax=Diaporthe vaccinii TaxID=105482 RepID=A0ABR4E5L7_9PEZI|nr:hypothetical protein LA080_014416 [Diaporthe eres]
MFGLVRGLLFAVSLVHVILAQQLFANEPTCAEGCYADAVSLSPCSPQDLACQCRSPNFAGIGLAGGPCFLAQCSLNDLSVLSSARTAACATATAASTATGTQSTAAATVTASPSSPSSPPSSSGTPSAPTSTARRVNTATASGEVIAAVPTQSPAAVQVVPDNGTMAAGSGQEHGQTLNAAAITGIVVSGGAVGLIGGILLYFFTVVRRRRMDQAHWDSLEREKAAMQQSLEELKMAVQRAGTSDSIDEKKGGGGGGGDRKRPRTINLTSSKGPGELGVPSRIFELPASPAKLEKI